MNDAKRLFRCCAGLWVMLLCLSGTAAGQPEPQNLDSLLGVINAHKADDTSKVLMYNTAAYLCRYVSMDSAQACAARGLAIAEKIHYERGQAECLKTIGITWLFMAQYDKAISYAKRALELFKKCSDEKGISSTYHLMGVICSRREQYDTANLYYNNAVASATKLKDTALVSDALDNIGSSYLSMGNYPDALDYFLKGLRLREQLGFKLTIAVSLSNVASVYSKLHDHKKALEYANRALDIQLVLDHKMGLAYTYENIGGIYREMKDNANAATYYRKALALTEVLGNRDQKDVLLVNLADIYADRQQYDSAMANYTLCLNDTMIKRPDLIANCHAGIGRIMLRRGRADAAVEHLLTAFTLYRDNSMKPQVAETANTLALALMRAGRDSAAYAFNTISNNYRDSIFNDENNKKVQQLLFDYQLEKKQDQIEILNKTRAISQARSWGLVTGMGLLLVIVALLVRGSLREKRTRNKIIKQKEEIQLQASKLEELNGFKDKTFSVLAHDMRGPLNAFNTTMTMIDEGSITVDEFMEIKPAMNQQLSALTHLLENLLNWSKTYMKGETTAMPAMVDLRTMAAQNIKLLNAAAAQKQITIANNIPEGACAYCDAGQIDIVMRNLMNNAIKFTPARGSVTLSATPAADTVGGRPAVTLHVADTGVGMTAERVNKLFSPAQGTTYGTDGEKGTGLGLLLCSEFVKANKGAISVISSPGNGSTFYVTLPKTA